MGTIGPGDTTPGSDRQEFDFDVASTLTGRVFYRDWSFVRTDGSVGTVTVDADTRTGIRRFRDGSDLCADFTHGVEFDGTGRQDTGELAGFTVAVCDNGPTGSGMDFFRIHTLYSYRREGSLTSGDVAKSGGGTPRANGVRVTGIGRLGSGVLPGSDVQMFEFDVAADLTGAKFYTDWGVIRPDGTLGTLRVDPLDLETRMTAFRDGSVACAEVAQGVEFEGLGRVNTRGDTNPDASDLVAFTVRTCDDGSVGSATNFYELTLFYGDFTTRYEKRGFLTAGDILKSRT